jgi:hypothetical protein
MSSGPFSEHEKKSQKFPKTNAQSMKSTYSVRGNYSFRSFEVGWNRISTYLGFKKYL